MSNETIARAIVYAARQALYINDYGMSWESIEVNTANILAGCSVPADGKMNSAEAVANHFSNSLTRGLLDIKDPDVRAEDVDLVKHLQGVITRQTASLRRIKGERDASRNDLAQLRRNWTEVIAERCQARLERDLALTAVRIEATAAQEARKEALANKAERDEARLEQDKYVRNLENLVDAERQRVADQHSHMLTRCRERDEARAERDAQITERNAADVKLAKLRTFLERGLANPFEWSDNAIKYLLEETK